MIAFMIIAGLVLLVVGGELLVRGASAIAAALQISPLVIGLTVVAFGTSAPELGVSLRAAYSGNAGVAIGNVIGSNIINVLFVLGAAAVVAPLIVHRDLVRRDVPLMIGASIATWGLSSDGLIVHWEGLAMFTVLCVYLVYSIRSSRGGSKEPERKVAHEGSVDSAASTDAGIACETGEKCESSEIDTKPMAVTGMLLNLGLFVLGLVLLGVGANWLVEGATSIARRIGVSDLVIGLTVVAIGTSLPEVVTSIVASYRGQRDIAVGNIVGSNLFNLLCVLGLTATLSPEPIPVSEDALAFDFPVMVAVAAICFPVFWAGAQVKRWEGGVFLVFYAAYSVVVIAAAQSSGLADRFGDIVLWGVVPAASSLAIASFVMARQKPSGQPD